MKSKKSAVKKAVKKAVAAKKSVKKAAPIVKKAPLVIAPPPLAMLTSWSYSVYSQYLKCPLQVCFEKIKRIKIYEPENPAFIKGNALHKNAEQYITGHTKEICTDLTSVTPRLKLFKKLKAKVEQDWAFTKDWLPTTWNDWSNCWLRMKVDAYAITPPIKKEPTLIQITDWKSGKVYPEHAQQRSLYGLGGLQLVKLGALPGGDDVIVQAEHLYTDTTQSATQDYTMKDLQPLKREWMSRVKDMMSDTRYLPRTGFHCRYCRFRKSNGGPCPENM